MDYEDIQNTVEKFHYELPLVASSEAGNQMTLVDGHDPDKGHYYKMTEFVSTDRVNVKTFYQDGTWSSENLDVE